MNTKEKTNTKELTIKDFKYKSKIENIVSNVILLITFIAFGFIAIMSFVQTCVIDPEMYESEHILFEFDFIVFNVLILFSFIFIAFKLNKLYNFFAKINTKFIYAGVFVYVLTLGLIWIFSVWQVPGADSANVFETATGAAKNDFSVFHYGNEFYFDEYYNGIPYFNFYPFQLGLVFISEILYRIFGTNTSMPLQVFNVICTAFAYCGIIRISKVIFNRKSIELICAVMLLGCLQPILLCSFPYGNLIGMSFSIWASYFIIKYLQTSKSLFIIPSALLITIGVLAKYNNLIYVVAFAIVLIIHAVRERKIKSLAFLLLISFIPVFANSIIIMSYEKRANVKLQEGMSQILYLDMGLNESFMAPGWYGGKTMKDYRDSGCNIELAEKIAKSDISLRVERFMSDPAYTYKFFTQKVLSQWNEPTYESIWVSKSKSHIYPINAIANSVYNGGADIILNMYFNQYMQILFLSFAAGLLCLILKNKARIENILLPLALLGGFGYHLFFEAKSQYALTYIIIMIPTASFAVQSLLIDSHDKVNSIIKKLKTIPTKQEIEDE